MVKLRQAQLYYLVVLRTVAGPLFFLLYWVGSGTWTIQFLFCLPPSLGWVMIGGNDGFLDLLHFQK